MGAQVRSKPPQRIPPNISQLSLLSHGDEASCDEGRRCRGCCPHEESHEAGDEGHEGHEGHEGDEGDEGHEGHEGDEEEVRCWSPSCYAGSCGMRWFSVPCRYHARSVHTAEGFAQWPAWMC